MVGMKKTNFTLLHWLLCSLLGDVIYRISLQSMPPFCFVLLYIVFHGFAHIR